MVKRDMKGDRETVLGVMALTGFLSMLVIIAERKGKNFFFG